MPARVTPAQPRRRPPRKPRATLRPHPAIGTETGSTYSAQWRPSREKYSDRSGPASPARRRNASLDVSTERGEGPGRRERSPAPTRSAAPPAAARIRPGSPERPAAMARITSASAKNRGWASPPAPSRAAAAHTPLRVPVARAAPAARNRATTARFAKYPPARWTANVPARTPASTAFARCAGPASAAAARPAIVPRTAPSPARTSSSEIPSVPERTRVRAGTPGRVPTAARPS